MYITKNVLLNGAAQSCTASVTRVVSNPIAISSEDSLRIKVKAVVSAISITNAITFKLQDSYANAVYEDVGSAGQASGVKKTATLGTAEVTTITFPSFAGAAQGDYVAFSTQAGASYAFWIDKNAAGTAPTGAAYVAATNKVKIPAVTGNSAAALAALAVTAIGTIANVTIVDNLDGTVTFTQGLGGATTDAVPHNTGDTGAGSITVNIDTAGSNGSNVNISTETISIVAHGFTTGQPVIYNKGSGLVIPGLTDGTTYYAISVTSGTFRLATTQALALASTPIDLSGYGTGTAEFYPAEYEISLIVDDATSETQLPLWPVARLAVTTGASDTCTVSAVWVSQRK